MEAHVLLIDDDPILNMISRRMIKNINPDLPVQVCVNGKAALDFFATHFTPKKHYVILLDINMPELNGWQFLDAFKEIETIQNYSNFTLYMLSSSTDGNDLEKAKSYPVVSGFLIKPITVELFKAVLGKYTS